MNQAVKMFYLFLSDVFCLKLLAEQHSKSSTTFSKGTSREPTNRFILAVQSRLQHSVLTLISACSTWPCVGPNVQVHTNIHCALLSTPTVGDFWIIHKHKKQEGSLKQDAVLAQQAAFQQPDHSCRALHPFLPLHCRSIGKAVTHGEGNQEVSNSWQLNLERNDSGWTLTEQQITFHALHSAVQSSLPLPLQFIHMYKNHDTCSKQHKNRETWTKQCDLGASVSEGC